MTTTPAKPTTARRQQPDPKATADLELEIEDLKRMNAELLDQNTTLSLRYWIDQLKQLRGQVEKLERARREQDTKINRLEDALAKARTAFEALQKEVKAKK